MSAADAPSGGSVAVEVLLPGVLREHADGLGQLPLELAGPATVGDAVRAVSQRFPALGRRLQDDTGALRRHVNLFVDGQDVRGLDGASTPLRDGAVLHVLPSVAGG